MNHPLKISTVTTLKAPLNVTLPFVGYHLNTGINHMYLFFDNPDDEAISFLRDHPRVTAFKCDQKHWKNVGLDIQSDVQTKQEANATLALQLAHQSGYEWLIHMDSDELIYGLNSVSDYFRQVPDHVDIVRFPVMEAAPQKLKYNDPFKDITYFKVYTALPEQTKSFRTDEDIKKSQRSSARSWHFKRRLAKYLGSKNAAKRKFLHGHINGKSATRTSASVKSIACHLPIPEDGASLNLIVSQCFFVLHYDCMGFENWKNKWENRIFGNQYFTPEKLSRYRINMHEEIKDAFENEDKLIAYYRSLYHLSGYDKKLLKSLGLLREIDLSIELFELSY